MKKFTCLFAMILFAVVANSQYYKNQNLSLQRTQNKISEISRQSNLFNNISSVSGFKPSSILKSLAVSNKLDSIIYQSYESFTDTWQNDLKEEYYYNSELQDTVFTESTWDYLTGKWKQIKKTVLSYNEDGTVHVLNEYNYNEESQSLIHDVRIFPYYNEGKKPDSIVGYRNELANSWIVNERQIYQYDELDRLSQVNITTIGEDEGVEYNETMSFRYIYNSGGQLHKISLFLLSEESEILFMEFEFIFDNTGRRIASEFSSFSFENFEFGKISRTGYEYNAEGEITVETTSMWNITEEKWEVANKSELTYTNLNYSDVAFPSYLEFFIEPEEIETSGKVINVINSFDLIESTWQNSEKITYYYSEGTLTGVKKAEQPQIALYPNPASDKITLKWQGYHQLSLEIYNITGVKVIERIVFPGMEIPVSSLNKGIYIYKLADGKQPLLSGKLIKK